MAKLTKAQKQEIEMAISAMERMLNFINRPEIAFCRVSEVNEKVAHGPLDYRARDSHRTQHYVGRDNYEWDINYIKEMTPMDKGIGSDLVAGYTTKKILERFLENNS